MAKARLNMYVTNETLNEVEQLAERLSLTKTGVASLALKLGMDLLKLATNKEFAGLLARDPEMMEKLERMVENAEKTE